jgi:hypothetical protein
MSQEKYIGMDVHQATISVAVLDSRGELRRAGVESTRSQVDARTKRWCK